jgi:flagella basal body P-ring formation protein FlgA
MRRNHLHDKDLLDKIERRLEQSEPTGFEVIDDLAATVPRADPYFQSQLEARLMSQYQSRTREERELQPMQTFTVTSPSDYIPRPRHLQPSLTLVAAALVMAIVAALLLIKPGSQPDADLGVGILEQDWTATPSVTFTPVPSVMYTPTAVLLTVTLSQDNLRETSMAIEATHYAETLTPTYRSSLMVPSFTPTPEFSPTPTASPIVVSPTAIPENMSVEAETSTNPPLPAGAVIAIPPSSLRMVVIAARDLPRGTNITQEDVILTYWPADAVPDGSYDGIVLLVGLPIVRDIPRWQPIFMDDVK